MFLLETLKPRYTSIQQQAATITPVNKSSTLKCLRPITLMSAVTKCFERLILQQIKASLPQNLDCHQFAYSTNRSTEDAIATALDTQKSATYSNQETMSEFCS